eukprot:TRINITY_DN5163_c0_g1_i3.p1 TRINITY_DN5163_c0_g1~~TRINITY_DN5163_c0_g1_i3.p1  ORF type:complete len:355 (+),score=62.27 TRINITY_DN5163_c0_g1_i3:1251-2315(+)
MARAVLLLLTVPLATLAATPIVALNPRGGNFVGTAGDDLANSYNLPSGTKLTNLTGHTGTVTSLSYRQDENKLSLASADGTVRVYDVDSGQTITVIDSGAGLPLNLARFGRTRELVVTRAADNTVLVYNGENGAHLADLIGHTAPITSARFGPVDLQLVTTSKDTTARLWNYVEETSVTLSGHTAAVNDAQISPDGATVLTASADRTLRLFDATTGATQHVLLGHSGSVTYTEFAPSSNQTAVSCGEDGAVLVHDLVAGSVKLNLTAPGATAPVHTSRYSADGKLIVSASEDKTARIYDAVSGKQLFSLQHSAAVLSAEFSPDAAVVVTAVADGTAVVWDATTGSSVVTVTLSA